MQRPRGRLNPRRLHGRRDPRRYAGTFSSTISAGTSLPFASAWARSSILDKRLAEVGPSSAKSHRSSERAGLRACRSIGRSASTID